MSSEATSFLARQVTKVLINKVKNSHSIQPSQGAHGESKGTGLVDEQGQDKFFLSTLSLTDLYTYTYYRYHTCVENDEQVDRDDSWMNESGDGE